MGDIMPKFFLGCLFGGVVSGALMWFTAEYSYLPEIYMIGHFKERYTRGPLWLKLKLDEKFKGDPFTMLVP